jgi:Phage integrase, N-terminal SAM-like domain
VAKRSKGAPGIYELEPGLYKVVISLGRDSTGRYRQHARTVRGTLRDAKALRSRALTEAADRKVVARADVTFGALLERWLEHLETLGRSPTTLAAYRVIVRCHLRPRLGGASVGSRLSPTGACSSLLTALSKWDTSSRSQNAKF